MSGLAISASPFHLCSEKDVKRLRSILGRNRRRLSCYCMNIDVQRLHANCLKPANFIRSCNHVDSMESKTKPTITGPQLTSGEENTSGQSEVFEHAQSTKTVAYRRVVTTVKRGDRQHESYAAPYVKQVTCMTAHIVDQTPLCGLCPVRLNIAKTLHLHLRVTRINTVMCICRSHIRVRSYNVNQNLIS